MIPNIEETLERLKNYLESGGLFNPEMMEHDKVRSLLIDCRTIISHFDYESKNK